MTFFAIPTVRTARDADAGPRVLVVMHLGEVGRWVLPATGILMIGRSRDCDIAIEDPSVSRQHARLVVGDDVTVEDLDSSNGTFVAGALAPPGHAVQLRSNEVLRFGQVTAIVHSVAGSGSVSLTSADELRAAVRGLRPAHVAAIVAVAVDRAAADEQLASVVGELSTGDLAARSAAGLLELVIHADSMEVVEARIAQVLVACRHNLGPLRAATRIAPRDGEDLAVLLDETARAVVPADASAPDGLIVQSAAMRALYALAEQLADGQLSVLLVGETGAGKEHLAERIHHASDRANEPFVRVNCAAFAETMFEAEFFGYERGAFTGATKPKAGLLEHAAAGTVFLDEVGEMPLPTQAKLLRVLEERQVMRVGSLKPRPIGARFVAATNKDLAREVARGTFRKDLYFRLAGAVLEIPPLRERIDEIRPLAEVFTTRAARSLGRAFVPRLSERSLRALDAHRWDGNVRELRNVMERAVLLCRGETIEVSHLLLRAADPAFASDAPTSAPEPEPEHEIDVMTDQEERLRRALERTGGNQKAAAKMLGVSRQTIGKWIDKYRVVRPRRRERDSS